MNRGDTALLVVDVQGKLVQLIPGHEQLVWNIGRLIDGAKILGLPVLATEQYPKGLGPTGNAAHSLKNSANKGFTAFWFAASRPMSACNRRCMTCWRRAFGVTWRSMPSGLVGALTMKSPCGGWTRPEPR